MTWNAFHNRGEILRNAIAAADERCDGRLPLDVAGVNDVFDDELDLFGAMMLKWHTRLAGNLERALADQPLNLEAAVAGAWAQTAAALPGVRAVMDNHASADDHPELAAALGRAREREWARLAISAGLANHVDAAAAKAGRHLEELGRASLETPQATERAQVEETSPSQEAPTKSFVDRIKAVLAA